MNAHTNKGRFGKFGGRYVPETLVPALDELEYNYKKMRNDARFKKELAGYLRTFAGRPTPMYYARTLTKYAGGARIYLKREDLLQPCTKIQLRLMQSLRVDFFSVFGDTRNTVQRSLFFAAAQ